MFPNAKGSELISILATIEPTNQAAGTSSTGWVPVANCHNLLAVIESGALGTNATLDAKLQQATDNAGAGAKDIPNKAITQLTQAASGSNRQVLINVRPEELDLVNGFGFVRLSVTVGVAASLTAAQLLGINPRVLPADAGNQAAVAQIV